MVEPGWFDGSQNLRRIGFELAQGALDADLPDRSGTYIHLARIDSLTRLLGEF
jgi:hypothetical protein